MLPTKENILLFGAGGSGKSTSIATLLKPALLEKFPDLKIRYLCTEANALTGMLAGLRHHKITPKEGQLAYMLCRPNPILNVSSAQIAKEYEENFLKLSNKEALEVKIGSGDRSKRQAFISILRSMASFKGIDVCTKEIKDYGDYLKWDENNIFVVDSLTAVCDYLVNEVKATRVLTRIDDYNHVQSNLMNKIIIPLTEMSQCSIIILGHGVLGEDTTVRQPKEEENKIMKLYPKTFGQALNDILPSKFSETIFSYVDSMDRFHWAGRRDGVATSPRKIPRKDKLEPDFSIYNLFE